MTRNDRIAQSARVEAASRVILSAGTEIERTYRAAYLARGRFSDVIALGAAVSARMAPSLTLVRAA